MEIYYQILDKFLRFENILERDSTLEKFVSTDTTIPDILLDCECEKQFSTINYKTDLPSNYGIQYLSADGALQVFFSQKDPRHFLYTEKEDYSELHFGLQKNYSGECFMELLMAGFYSYISLKEALLMHASAVSYKGNGIIFTASSGTGKTTQAELWQKYRDAVILNGDKAFLKQEKEGIHAWGSPWRGSSPYAENKSAPLRAIIVLEQAENNFIRELSGLETLERVIPHIFLPQWDMRCESAVLDFLDRVLRTVDIYLLQCRPDEEAVALTEKTLFG